MSGKVVALYQLMEHEALSIETDFSYLKDTDLKAFLSTGESLSNLRTALTRGEKLLLVDKPRAPMFIMDFPKADLSTEDRVKIILYSLTPMQVRQVHPAINPAYPKEIIKAIDSRLGTVGGVMVGGNPYKSPSSGSLHPAKPMKPLTPEPLVPDPVRPPSKPLTAPTFGMAPNRLVFRLVYDDKEQTKAGHVPYTVIMEDGKNTKITGTLDKSGRAEVRPATNHAAYILFGDEALAADAQHTLELAYNKLDKAISNSAQQSAEHAIEALSNQQKIPVTKAFSEAINNKLAELNNQSQAFDNQSFLSQSWDMMKAAQSGSVSGASEYLPDLGEFGELLHAADINVTMLIEAIVTGDIDALEDKFQAWKERGKQGMWEATETMEMLILLLSDRQGRELIASLPARMLAALPADKVVEMSAYHATQLGMDMAVVTGGTALGTLAGGVGGPIACASLLLAANSRKAGKVLEETIDVLGEMKDAIKIVRNNHDKPRLYKKDPSIPRDREDLNTRTFVTPLREKNNNKKQNDEDDKTYKCDWKDCKGKHEKPIHYAKNPANSKDRKNLERSHDYADKWTKAGLEPWVIHGAGIDTKATREEYLSETKKIDDVNKAVKMKHPEYPTQKHHLISVNLFTRVPKLKHNAILSGYNVNHPKNGICLPAFRFDIAQHNLQCHRGPHSKSLYNDKIEVFLRDLEKDTLNICSKNKNHQKTLTKELNDLSILIKKRISKWQYLLRTKAKEDREFANKRMENINKISTEV
ncbi:AHH domain-containing protein [uncultured Shewanella sp.]|uniref:AHH domain-containing protein n=1 Tax=uncultured Shewanella sp. TaxID=173975 RepID=UPI002609FC3C|nr:AHH domain-containing protein [uncultured Shewanella sp.]